MVSAGLGPLDEIVVQRKPPIVNVTRGRKRADKPGSFVLHSDTCEMSEYDR